MEERRSRLSVNQTDAITKRLSANRAKLHQNSGVPGLEAEVERLKESIEAVSSISIKSLYYAYRVELRMRMNWLCNSIGSYIFDIACGLK